MKPLTDLDDDELTALAGRALRVLPDAPADWLARARGLWPEAGAAGALRRWVAALAFDSWAQPAPALGMRAGGSEARQLLFSAEPGDVDLRITPAGAGFELRGQLLGPQATRGRVGWQAEAGGAMPEAALDADGEFLLAAVPPGRGRLTLTLSEDEFVLPLIELGPPPA
jgi:hypothetical protein